MEAENEQLFWEEEYVDEQNNSGNDSSDEESRWLFETDDDEGEELHEDEDEDEDEWIPVIDDNHEADLDDDGDDGDDDDDDGGGGGGEGEANETEMDGFDQGDQVAAEITGGDSGMGNAAESDRSNSPDCPICFRPWTADGPHRVCCFPCGHVHGRSCLEIWLQRCEETNVKCPQCYRKFSRHEIINLYAPTVVIPTVRPYKTQIHELSSRQSKGSTSGRRHIISSNLGEEMPGCSHCSEELQEMAMDLETRVSRLENFEIRHTQFRDMQNEVAELRIEMIEAARLRGDVAELKNEMAEMRNEMVVVAELQHEVASLKREMTEMRNAMIDAGDFIGELYDLKSNITEISTEMKEMKGMFAEMRSIQDEQPVAKRRRLTTADSEASGSVNP